MFKVLPYLVWGGDLLLCLLLQKKTNLSYLKLILVSFTLLGVFESWVWVKNTGYQKKTLW